MNQKTIQEHPETQEPFEDTGTQQPEGATQEEAEFNLQSLVNRRIELHRRKQERKEDEDRDNAELARIDPIISERFAALQIRQQKSLSGETIYIQRETYVSLVRDENGDLSQAHQAMQENGLGWMVQDNVNAQRLAGWVREQERNNAEIPEGLLPFLKISRPYRVRVRL